VDCVRDELLVTLPKPRADITSLNWLEASDQLHVTDILTPGKELFGFHEVGVWVGPRGVLDVLEKRKICCVCW
jgi:hypothetical protein